MLVGQLTGFPFPVGKASVFSVGDDGEAPSVFATGLTTVVDVGTDRRGNVYALQISSNGLAGDPGAGKLLRINDAGATTEIAPNST